MNIARPKDGFDVRIKHEDDKARIAEFKDRSPACARCWDGMMERLRMSAHKDGEPVPFLGNGFRAFVTGPDEIAGTPRILVVYLALGNWVSIQSVAIS